VPCYHPLEGYRSIHPNSNGKYPIHFDRGQSNGIVQTIPCGQCIGCKLDRSLSWAIRCHHEAQLHENNCFITLTYDEANLPQFGSLEPYHFQLFMKRLRKHFEPLKIRYFHCGEYGEKLGRPHYHACVFGLDLPDKQFYKKINGVPLFTSPLLDKIWGKGITTVGDVTFESAAYVARYILKKITGDAASKHYLSGVVDYSTGAIETLLPEYTTMSRRPGIASAWYDEFKSDVFPSDEVIIKGKQLKPPRYYQQIYQRENPEEYDQLLEKRKTVHKLRKSDNTPERLKAKEKVKKSKLKLLKRTYEA